MSTEELREERREPRSIPLEVLNAELAAKLDFTERRLLSMATVAYELQVKCGELSARSTTLTEQVASLQRDLEGAQGRDAALQPQDFQEPNVQRRRNRK